MVNKLEMLKILFNMQNDANTLTNGDCWVEGFNENGLEINWCRCMRFELVEAIDQSFSWKHWKNIKNNNQYDYMQNGLHNVKIELVDVFHFLMSENIKQSWTSEMIALFDKFDLSNTKIFTQIELIQEIENLERIVFNYEDDNTFQNMKILYNTFWKVVLSVMTFNEVYEMYILKNTLNIFRQNNGYKDGSYIKEWGIDKLEDNLFLETYINDGGIIDYNSITNYLDKKYQELNNI